MKSYKYILFDLDGTITNSAPGVTNSFAYALEKFDIVVNDRTELNSALGPPLRDTFEGRYNLTPEQAGQAIDHYGKYYETKGYTEKNMYHGIVELLEKLKAAGKILIVATAKSQNFAEQDLEHLDIAKYFTFVSGVTFDGLRNNKNDVIEHALKSCEITDTSNAVMIGDRKHDILGAKKFGLDSIGVLYGYGSRDELESANADFIAETVADVEGLLG